jgi:hypothetical protein
MESENILCNANMCVGDMKAMLVNVIQTLVRIHSWLWLSISAQLN